MKCQQLGMYCLGSTSFPVVIRYKAMLSIRQDSFEYWILFSLAVCVAVTETIIKNCVIMLRGEEQSVPFGDTTTKETDEMIDYSCFTDPKKVELYDSGVEYAPGNSYEIERLLVTRYLERFSLASIKAECKAMRVSTAGRKDEVIDRFIDEMLSSGLGFTRICEGVRAHQEFMKGREHG